LSRDQEPSSVAGEGRIVIGRVSATRKEEKIYKFGPSLILILSWLNSVCTRLPTVSLDFGRFALVAYKFSIIKVHALQFPISFIAVQVTWVTLQINLAKRSIAQKIVVKGKISIVHLSML